MLARDKFWQEALAPKTNSAIPDSNLLARQLGFLLVLVPPVPIGPEQMHPGCCGKKLCYSRLEIRNPDAVQVYCNADAHYVSMYME